MHAEGNLPLSRWTMCQWAAEIASLRAIAYLQLNARHRERKRIWYMNCVDAAASRETRTVSFQTFIVFSLVFQGTIVSTANWSQKNAPASSLERAATQAHLWPCSEDTNMALQMYTELKSSPEQTMLHFEFRAKRVFIFATHFDRICNDSDNIDSFAAWAERARQFRPEPEQQQTREPFCGATFSMSYLGLERFPFLSGWLQFIGRGESET